MVLFWDIAEILLVIGAWCCFHQAFKLALENELKKEHKDDIR